MGIAGGRGADGVESRIGIIGAARQGFPDIGNGEISSGKHFADYPLHARNVCRAEFIRVVEVEDEDIGVLLLRPTRRGAQRVPFERTHGELHAVGLAAQQEAVQHGLAGERNRGGLVKKDVEARPVLREPGIGESQGLREPCDDGRQVAERLPSTATRDLPGLNAGLDLYLQACAIVGDVAGIESAGKAEHRAEVRAYQLLVPVRQIAEAAHDFERKVVREDLLELPNQGLIGALFAVGEQCVEDGRDSGDMCVDADEVRGLTPAC